MFEQCEQVWMSLDKFEQIWRILKKFGIDSRIGAAASRAPAASREDSCPQAILKFQPRNSFDYMVRYEPQLGYIFLHYFNLSRNVNVEFSEFLKLDEF